MDLSAAVITDNSEDEGGTNAAGGEEDGDVDKTVESPPPTTIIQVFTGIPAYSVLCGFAHLCLVHMSWPRERLHDVLD